VRGREEKTGKNRSWEWSLMWPILMYSPDVLLLGKRTDIEKV
jgi:hypothetical protein